MTKLEAIARLEKAFQLNPEFKKKWADYIEIIVLDELEDSNGKRSRKPRMVAAKDISAHILRTMFSVDWWEAQGLK